MKNKLNILEWFLIRIVFVIVSPVLAILLPFLLIGSLIEELVNKHICSECGKRVKPWDLYEYRDEYEEDIVEYYHKDCYKV